MENTDFCYSETSNETVKLLRQSGRAPVHSSLARWFPRTVDYQDLVFVTVSLSGGILGDFISSLFVSELSIMNGYI